MLKNIDKKKIIDFLNNEKSKGIKSIWLNEMKIDNFISNNNNENKNFKNDSENKAILLKELCKKIQNCKDCNLFSTRIQAVCGKGNPNAKLMLIGEAPGADEDKQGEPFVGKAGQLLTKILEAINIKREEVFIANIVKCRPPNNADPTIEQRLACLKYLEKQIEIINPKIILALGRISGGVLSGNMDAKLKDLRGKLLDYKGIKFIVTYHPAALLRNPEYKKPTWEDIQLLKKYYDEVVSNDRQ